MTSETPTTSLLNFAALSILFSGVLYIGIIASSSSTPSNSLLFSTKPASHGQLIKSAPVAAPEASNAPAPDELELALSKAAMENKTLIIAVVNRAYAEQGIETDRTMLDLFVESFWLGEGTRWLLDHVLVVTMDLPSYRRCEFRRLNCYRLATDGVDFGGEKLYMSKDFVAMMWRRTSFLADVLRRGYNFIFTDTDIVWLRNPFSQLSQNQTVDLQLSTDWFNGDPWSDKNYMNTGFYFIRSNNKTVSLLDTWYSQKDNATGKKEQDVLLELVQGGIFSKLGLRVRFLDTVYFSGFCTDSKNFTAVTTVHANCCRSIKAKVHDLTAVFHDWKRYQWSSQRLRGGGRNRTVAYKWSKHVGCVNSWRTYTEPDTVRDTKT